MSIKTTPDGAQRLGPNASTSALAEVARLSGEVDRLSGVGDLDAAIARAERLLALHEEALGPEHPDVAQWLNRLAELYSEQEDYAKAEALYQRALAIYEEALGPKHPDVAQSLNSLAGLFRTKGDHGKAEPLYQRALAILEKTLGPEHPAVASLLNNFAVLYQMKGDDAKAKPLIQRALVIVENAREPDDPDGESSINEVAQLSQTHEQDVEASASTLAEAKRLGFEVARLYAAGEFESAIPLAQRALDISEAIQPEHPDVATSLNNLATLYNIKGDYGRAEPLFQRALTILEKTLGPVHPNVANSLNNLACLYNEQGVYAKAEPLFQRALTILENALGPLHPDVAGTLNNLAFLYASTRDGAQAESFHQRALAIKQNALGPEHPDVALSLDNLAMFYYERGDYGRAEPLFQRAVAIREKVLWPEHPDMINSLERLAMLYHEKGDYAKAEQLLQRAFAIREEALGPEHTDVAFSLNNIAALYRTKGDYVAAEPLLQRSLAIFAKALGADHTNVATVLHNLALVYSEKGRYAKAEPAFQRALFIKEKVLGPDHPEVASLLKSLAEMYHNKGDLANAEPLYLRSLSIRENALGPDHLHVADSFHNLAGLYVQRGDYANAEPLYQRALSLREKVLGPDHPRVASSLNNLAALYDWRGDHAKVEPLCLRSLSIRENALGSDHPDVAASLNNLAWLYHQREEYVNAESLYLRSLSIRENALGPNHPDVAASFSNLAALYQAVGEPTKAISTMGQAATIQDSNSAVLLSTGSDDQKRAYMVTLRGFSDQAISLHVQVAPNAHDAKRLALSTILNRKGRVLDAMTDSFTALRRSLTPVDEERLGKLRSVCAQYSALVWRGPANTPIDDYRTILARLDEERQKLEADISRRGVELHGELQPVTLEQVQAGIPVAAALVELFWYSPYHPKEHRRGKPRYVAYVLRRNGEIAWADLGEAALIEAAVRRLLHALSRPATGPKATAARAAARDLDGLVMQPIRELLGSTHQILLSPDGLLNLVPFAALVDEQGHYLIERYLLTYLASGRDLLRTRARFPARQAPVVVAAPDYDAVPVASAASDGDSRGKRSADMTGISFSPLHFAAAEGRAIAGKFSGSTLLTGAAATESAVKMLTGPRLLHIATHGFFLPDQPPPEPALHTPPFGERHAGLRAFDELARPAPAMQNPLLRSGIALAGANCTRTDEDDGILTALEVSQLDLTGTKLVVLSACETGVGEIHSGDGVYGLRRAMVIAGAETQVMSLWSVDDAATRELMEAYYDKLLAGGGRSEAMRQAQLEMLGRPGRAHPYYWASFIVSGSDAPLD